jgi:hypothetical protein
MTDTATEAADPGPQLPAEVAELGTPTQPNIDIAVLAEKVYRLMMAEIRLDHARGLASDSGG